MPDEKCEPTPARTVASTAAAYMVHLYTASGVAFAFWATAELTRANPDPRTVFLLLIATVVIDGTDGPLARRFHVKVHAPAIDGRGIDDIVDYLTYTFIPLLLIWRMGWVPEPTALWIVPALVASLFGFANVAAKDESGGFFLGFPSYWNAVALYAGIIHHLWGPWPNAAITLVLALLTVVPVRFIYPNLAPSPWKQLLLATSFAWVALVVMMLPNYPAVPAWMLWVSLVGPAMYVGASVWLSSRPGATGSAARGA